MLLDETIPGALEILLLQKTAESPGESLPSLEQFAASLRASSLSQLQPCLEEQIALGPVEPDCPRLVIQQHPHRPAGTERDAGRAARRREDRCSLYFRNSGSFCQRLEKVEILPGTSPVHPATLQVGRSTARHGAPHGLKCIW